MPFAKLGLRDELVRAVAAQGYQRPTPIQKQAIPIILDGRDLIGSAQTGTGKTAGFALPLLQRLLPVQKLNSGRRAVRGLVITPTRELAMQVAASISIYGKGLPLRAAAVYGGVSLLAQQQNLQRGIDVLVATPGRLLDHLGRGNVDFSQLELLVLDEADRMLDMGFIHDIRKLLAHMPRQKQTLLFSATFSNEVRKLAGGLLQSPAFIEVARRNSAAATVRQLVYPVDKQRKRELLSYLIGANRWQQVLIFNRTKHGANRLAEQLNRDGISAAAIHGNKSQGARTRALADFRNNKVLALVATDIAARGLDIDRLPRVVNFDLPNIAEDYVHRIGRTGRAGQGGEAISLVCVDEQSLLRDIERLLKCDIPCRQIDGFERDPGIKAEVKARQPSPGRRKSRRARAANAKRGLTKHSTRTANPRRPVAA